MKLVTVSILMQVPSDTTQDTLDKIGEVAMQGLEDHALAVLVTDEGNADAMFEKRAA